MATGERVTLYFGENEVELRRRFEKLNLKTGVCMNRLYIACLEACIATLEKEMPKNREFKLNGEKVVL